MLLLEPTSRTAPVLTLVLVLLAAALAGCVGTDAPPDDGGDGADPAGTDGDDEPSQSPSDGDPNQTPPGDDDGSDGGGAGADDGEEAPPARTPDDAMPGHEPVESGEGFAHFVVEDHANFAFDYLFNVADGDTYAYPLTVVGDETLIEVALTWDQGTDVGPVGEDELIDLNLVVRDARTNPVNNSGNGQAFVNRVCSHIGECIFVFTPNGEVWEYLQLTPGSGPHADAELGEWTIEVVERNNWNPDSVAGTAGATEGSDFRLDVWVYTAEPDELHHPEQAQAA